MTSILVIGAVSLDTLHIHDTTYATMGGAALYTALAIHSEGATAVQWAPKPDPMQEDLSQIEDYVEWVGPRCALDQLARLEIAHHGDGKATLLGATWGATTELNPLDLPEDLSPYGFIHIAALPDAKRQLEFLRVCRQRKAKSISCGTYGKLAYNETADVRALLAESNLFFMNENEAIGLFGSVEAVTAKPSQTIYVTLDRDGAIVVTADAKAEVVGTPVEEVDPTGAGDTFCGATLARLVQGDSGIDAAEIGWKRAALTVQGIGPSSLLNLSAKNRPDNFG